ncbi:MAG: Uma2 family endonuclease [Bacteroidota bacterium]
MTKIITKPNPFIIPISADADIGNAVFESLLGGGYYVAIGTQILFERDGQFFLTMIDNEHQSYTKEDYGLLPFKAPYQLINGKLTQYNSATSAHQVALGNLLFNLALHTKDRKLGKVLFKPLDIHFDDSNVLQPDLFFISNERKGIVKNYVYGAPDLVIEIAEIEEEPELVQKIEVYGKHNVLEYWAISYKDQTLDAYLNEGEKLVWQQQYQVEEEVKSAVIEGFSFTLGDIFE